MTEQQQWDEIFKYAGVIKAQAGDFPPVFGIKGRFITALVERLTDFWQRHRDTLAPYLTQIAIAAIEAVLANKGAYQNLNNPGPR